MNATLNPSLRAPHGYAHQLHAVLAGCRDALEQCHTVAGLLSAAQWSASTEHFSCIGAHMRHCTDHFDCLLDGLSKGLVNYDARRRDPRLESDPVYFRHYLEKLLERLEDVADLSQRLALSIEHTVGADGAKERHSSTLARELAFLSGHVLHHLALVKIIASTMQVKLPEKLGVAFSTLDYRRATSH